MAVTVYSEYKLFTLLLSASYPIHLLFIKYILRISDSTASKKGEVMKSAYQNDTEVKGCSLIYLSYYFFFHFEKPKKIKLSLQSVSGPRLKYGIS